MRSTGENILRLIDDITQKLDTIKQAVLTHESLDKTSATATRDLEKMVVGLRNLSIYRDYNSGSSYSELSKKYKLTIGGLYAIMRKLNKIHAPVERK